MTAAVHGPRVTQADRLMAEGLRDAIKNLACSDPENATRIVMLAVSDLEHLSAQALSRHREASQAELVEALERAIPYLEDAANDCGCGPNEPDHILDAARAALTKSRTDATGEGA